MIFVCFCADFLRYFVQTASLSIYTLRNQDSRLSDFYTEDHEDHERITLEGLLSDVPGCERFGLEGYPLPPVMALESSR